MPKPKDPESYEVAGTAYRQHEDPRATLEQAFSDYITTIPTRNFTKRVNGDQVTIYCHCHEQNLGDPRRRDSQVDVLSKSMDRFVTGLKRRFRELGAGVLDIDEVKGGRGYDLQKVSLNDRWEMVYRRVYRIADLLSQPGD